MTPRSIALLPGDGIGPEIVAAAVEVLDAVVGRLRVRGAPDRRRLDRRPRHRAHRRGRSRPAARADAVLLGAVGGPKWDTTDPDAPRPEQGLLGLRKGLGLFANLRPVRPIAGAARRQPAARASASRAPTCWSSASSPAASTSARRRRDGDRANDVCAYTRRGDRADRPRRASSAARAQASTSVDKANVLETSRLWREVVTRVHADEYPDVELEHLLVDNAAMQLVSAPAPTST